MVAAGGWGVREGAATALISDKICQTSFCLDLSDRVRDHIIPPPLSSPFIHPAGHLLRHERIQSSGRLIQKHDGGGAGVGLGFGGWSLGAGGWGVGGI